jgi:hypothetical protein
MAERALFTSTYFECVDCLGPNGEGSPLPVLEDPPLESDFEDYVNDYKWPSVFFPANGDPISLHHCYRCKNMGCVACLPKETS